MSGVLSFIYFILILSVIIIVHELGHLIAAKKFNVYCKEFSIGMGPVVWQKQKGETAWSIRAFPIGGFVAMAGEEGEEEDTDEDIPFERTINGISPLKQIVVMGAGAFMNIVLAWLIFIGITAWQGAVSVPSKAIVQTVAPNYPAEKAGFHVGDEVVKIQSKEESINVKSSDDVVEFIQYYPQDLTFTVLRDNKEVKLHMDAQYNEEDNIYQMGVQYPQGEIKKLTLLESIPYGTERMIDSVKSVIDALGKLIQGVGLQNLSGPVGIYNVTAEITQAGFIPVLALIALLSVNIGVMNLVPIPILDGGRIFIILIETLIGRKLNEKVQTAVMMAGLILIVGLMVFATWNDVVRLL